MATRWYREQLPRLEFLGERGAVKWVVLRDPQIDQALKLTLFISGATAGPGSSAQDNAFSVLLVGADGIQQAYGGESSNLSGAGTQEVGLVVNEFSPVLLRMHWMGVVRSFCMVGRCFVMILCQRLPWISSVVFTKCRLILVSAFI